MSGPFEPKKFKYAHCQKRLRQLRGENSKSLSLKFGTIGCRVNSSLILTSRHKEGLRLLVLRILKKFKANDTKIIWRFACNIPQTKKSINSRMGCGVGGLENWIAKIKSKSIIFELINFDLNAEYFNKIMERFKIELGAWFSVKIDWVFNFNEEKYKKVSINSINEN